MTPFDVLELKPKYTPELSLFARIMIFSIGSGMMIIAWVLLGLGKINDDASLGLFIGLMVAGSFYYLIALQDLIREERAKKNTIKGDDE
jgi:hypothetical protein